MIAWTKYTPWTDFSSFVALFVRKVQMPGELISALHTICSAALGEDLCEEGMVSEGEKGFVLWGLNQGSPDN